MGQSSCDCCDYNCTLENKKQTHKMIHTNSQGSWISIVIMMTLVQGIFSLQCEVGINNETSAMECEGSWDKMQEVMKDKMGGKWDEMKNNLTGDMAGLIEQFKKQFEELTNSLENALKGEDRRKREVDSLFRVKRAEDGEAEPEAEPEGEDYYCIKKTMGDNTVKSCLPKSLADPLKMACSLIPSEGTICVCNDEDLCNSGQKVILTWQMAVMVMLAVFWTTY